MIAESETWIDGALNSQRANGDFGPLATFGDDGTRDFWANMTMKFCLESDAGTTRRASKTPAHS